MVRSAPHRPPSKPGKCCEDARAYATLWIAPSEKETASVTKKKRLWDAADQYRANSGLKAQEYSGPILGLIFLRFAEVRFAAALPR